MSASLVGLGDVYKRQGLLPVDLPKERFRHAGGASRVVRGGGGPLERPLAVSYTHLTLPTICSV
eukprot:5580188-Alexandrium_andersonii.AAC.1